MLFHTSCLIVFYVNFNVTIVCRVFELRKPFLFMTYQCLLLPDVFVGLGSEPHISVNFRADLSTLGCSCLSSPGLSVFPVLF